jgi:hydrogenase-4 component F
VVRLSFVLAVLGYGTKMGLVPVHTWLPDAHSEAPTPVSALLSGALLAVSFYAILRFYQVTVRAVGPTFPRDILLAFGVASLGLAALYLAAQRDLKRLFAYSSVEHMGVLAIGMSFSAPIAVVGVLLHVLAHAAAKGTAFFGAGSVVRKFGTKEIARIQGGVGALPFSGPMLVLAALGLCALPPFGIFRSEFLIVSGGLSDPRDAVAAVLVVLVTLASLGLTWFSSQTLLTPTPEGTVRAETSFWIVGAMVIGLAALALLGVHPPGQLSDLLTRAAHELGSGS